MTKFHVSESIVIESEIEQVFEVVKDFNKWPAWSPWACLEPEAEKTIEMTDDGVGSFYYWNGELTGEGTIEHVEIKDGEFIDQSIAFLKPYKSNDRVWWDFEKVDAGVKVTWNMTGNLPFFMFFMKKKMSAWIGMDYKRGLVMLKAFVETGEVPAESSFDGLMTLESLNLVGVTRECGLSEMGDSMKESFEEVMMKVGNSSMEMKGTPLSVYLKYDMVNSKCKYMAAIPVDKFVDVAGLERLVLPELRCLKSTHRGSYEFLGNAWATLMMRIRPMKLKFHRKYVGLEVYLTDPNEVKPADNVTEVLVPVR